MTAEIQQRSALSWSGTLTCHDHSPHITPNSQKISGFIAKCIKSISFKLYKYYNTYLFIFANLYYIFVSSDSCTEAAGRL